MARIPSGDGTARDRLVGAERILLARAGGANELVAPAHAPETLADLAVLARFVFDAATQLGVPAVDVAWLLERLFTLLASLRRAARRAVGPPELVGLRAGRQALGGVPPLPRRRADADARRRAGEAR